MSDSERKRAQLQRAIEQGTFEGEVRGEQAVAGGRDLNSSTVGS